MSTREPFQAIREFPAMYLAPPSAKTLHAFLSGYEFANKDSDPEFFTFLSEFGDWVRKRYNINSSQHWSKIIEFYSLTESEEMALFWKLLDEFESKSKSKRRRSSTTQPTTAVP